MKDFAKGMLFADTGAETRNLRDPTQKKRISPWLRMSGQKESTQFFTRVVARPFHLGCVRDANRKLDAYILDASKIFTNCLL